MPFLSASAQVQASLLLRLHTRETWVVAHTLDTMFKSNFLCVLSSSSHCNTSFLISSSVRQYFPFYSAQFKSHHEADMGKKKQPPKILPPNLQQLLQQFYSIIHELLLAIFLLLHNLPPTLMLRRNNWRWCFFSLVNASHGIKLVIRFSVSLERRGDFTFKFPDPNSII